MPEWGGHFVFMTILIITSYQTLWITLLHVHVVVTLIIWLSILLHFTATTCMEKMDILHKQYPGRSRTSLPAPYGRHTAHKLASQKQLLPVEARGTTRYQQHPSSDSGIQKLQYKPSNAMFCFLSYRFVYNSKVFCRVSDMVSTWTDMFVKNRTVFTTMN